MPENDKFIIIGIFVSILLVVLIVSSIVGRLKGKLKDLENSRQLDAMRFESSIKEKDTQITKVETEMKNGSGSSRLKI
jgi:hypothetical protein